MVKERASADWLPNIRETIQMTTSNETLGTWNATPEHGWTCFHCGETFTTVGSARDHFGSTPSSQPGCMIRVQFGDERGLQMALRKVEDEVERLRADINNETTFSQRFYNQLESIIAGYSVFKTCRTIQDIFNLYDSLEGEKISLAEKNEQLKQQLAETQMYADRWNAFINCDRISLHGWAGADLEGYKKLGDNYVHFGAEFWTEHPSPKAPLTYDLAKRILTTFADAAIAQQKEGGSDENN